MLSDLQLDWRTPVDLWRNIYSGVFNTKRLPFQTLIFDAKHLFSTDDDYFTVRSMQYSAMVCIFYSDLNFNLRFI